ncbi:MAG: helix-turn-helix transcriptional regulator [Eubacterium sp.]|nr:helix-turn-helix transcriptional regulator [Eubacterium sp.]
MKLRLPENIKKYRKEKALTQEKLAEALGVTVGAVSKWENGNNAPDLMVLMELADLFDISVDVLLGYDMASKKIENIVENITSLADEHNYEEAEVLSRDALLRYPNDFSVIFAAAMMYYTKSIEYQDVEAAKVSVELFERAKDNISQNKNPCINDYLIDTFIASNYTLIDETVALEMFKKINFGGVNDTVISLVCLENNDVKQALEYSTSGLINHLANVINSSMFMLFALSRTGKKKDKEAALELADVNIDVMRRFETADTGYFTKLEALFYILKAYINACLGMDKDMKKCVETGKALARKYDEDGMMRDVAKSIKFYYSDKETFNAIDAIGESAVEGIGESFMKLFSKVSGGDKKILKKLSDCWDES